MYNKIEHLANKSKIRIVSIPDRIEAKEVYAPRNPLATALTTLLWSAFLRGKNIKGLENLDKAMTTYSEANPLTLVGPHVSDADTLFLEQAVRGKGRGKYADMFVYIAGLNMEERPYIRINTLGGNRIFVETPIILEDLEEVLKSDEQVQSRDLFEKHLDSGKLLNIAALKEVIHARRRRQVLVLYPQSTRSTDGFIQKGHPKTEIYLKSGIILPFMVRGSEKFMPAKQIPPILKWIMGWKVDVEFGQPFYAKETRSPETLKALSDIGASPVDLVMARIGRMDWQRVHPDIRDFHQKLDERLPLTPLAASYSRYL